MELASIWFMAQDWNILLREDTVRVVRSWYELTVCYTQQLLEGIGCGWCPGQDLGTAFEQYGAIRFNQECQPVFLGWVVTAVVWTRGKNHPCFLGSRVQYVVHVP
jgi:hypothetical protein